MAGRIITGCYIFLAIFIVPVDIRYNLLDCTYVYFELEKETVCFELSDDYSSFRGLSWAEVDWIRKQGKADEHNFRNEDYEVDANLDYLYEEAAKEAERGKSPSILSKSRQIADVTKNRQKEIARNQKAEKEVLSEPAEIMTEDILMDDTDQYMQGLDESLLETDDFYDLIDELTKER